jgi:uncharacterized protein (TIRG00374 family)
VHKEQGRTVKLTNVVKQWVGVVISFVFIVLVFQKLKITEIVSLLPQVNVGRLLTGYVLSAVYLLLISFRTRFLLGIMGIHISFKSIFNINIISQYYSMALGTDMAGAGLRWVKLSGENNRHSIFAALLTERVLDNLIWVLLGLMGVGVFPHTFRIIYFCAISGIVICGILFFRWSGEKRIMHRSKRSLRTGLIVRVGVVWNSLMDSMSLCFKMKSIGRTIMLSLVVTMVDMYSKFILAKAIVTDINFVGFIVANSLFRLAVQLPISVGGIGLREYLYGIILPLWGVAPLNAMGTGVVGSTWRILVGIAGFIVDLYEKIMRQRTGDGLPSN